MQWKQTDPIRDEAYRLVSELKAYPAESEEYATICARLLELSESEKRLNDTVSNDTKAKMAASLAGILLVVGYEHGHVIASKGLSLISKIVL